MPVLVSVEDDKILLNVRSNDDSIFRGIINELKNHHAVWNDKKVRWSLKPAFWNETYPTIEDYEPIIYTGTAEQDIEKLILGTSQIKYWDDPIRRTDLKLQPIKGKAPYENYQLEDISNAFNTKRQRN